MRLSYLNTRVKKSSKYDACVSLFKAIDESSLKFNTYLVQANHFGKKMSCWSECFEQIWDAKHHREMCILFSSYELKN